MFFAFVIQPPQKTSFADFLSFLDPYPLSFHQVLGGTVLYAPPDDDEMSFSFDDWACGIILFAMLTSSLPFTEADLISKKNLILRLPEDYSDGTLPRETPPPFSFVSHITLFPTCFNSHR